MNILLDLAITFAKIGAFTFGGGYAMISIIEHECVEKKQWITEDELMDMTIIAESTPGPVAVNCATYTGYKKAGMLGAICATIGMVLPSFVILLIISTYLERFMDNTYVAKAFVGIRVCVSLLIISTALRMIRKALKKTANKAIDLFFILGFFAFSLAMNLLHISISTILLIVVSGLLGYCIYSLRKESEK